MMSVYQLMLWRAVLCFDMDENYGNVQKLWKLGKKGVLVSFPLKPKRLKMKAKKDVLCCRKHNIFQVKCPETVIAPA